MEDISEAEGLRRARVYGSLSRFRFAPRPRFRLFACGGSLEALSAHTLAWPRPVDYLTGLRLAGSERGSRSMAITARDALVLEVLVSALYEQNDALWAPDWTAAINLGLKRDQCFVLIAAIMNILRSSGRKHLTERELMESLERLSSSTATLPSIRVPRVRNSARRKLLAQYVPSVDETHDLPPEIPPVAPPVEQEVGRMPPEVQAIVYKLVPRTLTHVGPQLADLPAVDDIEPGEDPAVVRFRPLTRYLVESGVVVFELHPHLRAFMSSRRLVDWNQVPYAYLDLRIAAHFSSPYTLPFYRQLVAQAYDRKRGVIRYDEVWTWKIAAEDLARAIGYQKQAGGIRGQLERNVLAKIASDLNKIGPDGFQFVLHEKASRGDRELVFTVHRPLPRSLNEFGRQRTYINKYIDAADRLMERQNQADKAARRNVDDTGKRVTSHRKVIGETEPDQNYNDAQTNLRFAEFRRLFPSTAAPFNMPKLEPMGRVSNHLKLRASEKTQLAKAWQVAIDETYHSLNEYYGDVTGRGQTRSYRGAKLLETVLKEGSERAFILFALEEARDPDLTQPSTYYRLELEGTLAAADADRRSRLAEKRGYPPRRIERNRIVDGIEEAVASAVDGRLRDEQVERELRAAKTKKLKELKGVSRQRRLSYRKMKATAMRTLEEKAYDLALGDFTADELETDAGQIELQARFEVVATALRIGLPVPDFERVDDGAIDDIFAVLEAEAEAEAHAVSDSVFASHSKTIARPKNDIVDGASTPASSVDFFTELEDTFDWE